MVSKFCLRGDETKNLGTGKGRNSGHSNIRLTPENVLAVRVEVDVKADTVGCLELLDLSNKTLVLGGIASCLAWVKLLGQPGSIIKSSTVGTAFLPLYVSEQGSVDAPPVADHWYGQLRLMSRPTQELPLTV